jgi:two-component system, chemotaxis family, chemotaxis protein CheY
MMGTTILYVDDSTTLQMSIKMMLSMNGFTVETAGDGIQAMAKLKSGLKPDMVITDINMPNMGGMELIKSIRGLPGFRFVPIVTLTTETQAEKREEGKRLGATGWMQKPISANDLIAVIKKLVPGA